MHDLTHCVYIRILKAWRIVFAYDSSMLDALRLYTYICWAYLVCNKGGAIWTAKFSYPPPHILATQKFFCFLRKYHDNLYLEPAIHASPATPPVFSVSNLLATVLVFNLSATVSVSYLLIQHAVSSMSNLPTTVSVSYCFIRHVMSLTSAKYVVSLLSVKSSTVWLSYLTAH